LSSSSHAEIAQMAAFAEMRQKTASGRFISPPSGVKEPSFTDLRTRRHEDGQSKKG
jgi:hypothetical protein